MIKPNLNVIECVEVIRLRAFSAISAFVLGCNPALGQEAEADPQSQAESRNPLHESGSEREHLTGDWWGLRTSLVERGVHVQVGYIGEVFANVSGGLRRDARYEGLGEMALNIDFERLTGKWHGGSFRASTLWLLGDGPSELANDALIASNIDGYDSLRLYELWVQQNVFNNCISLRAGSLLADKEFTGTEYGGRLLNSAFGWPAFISGNVINTGPAFYVASPGVRLRLDPGQQWYAQAGVYDGDSFDSRLGNPRVNASGTHFHLNSTQGALALAETGWRRNSDESDDGLPGVYKLGGWIHTADFGRGHENFGAYMTVEQLVWRENGTSGEEGLGVFFRAGGSPAGRSAFPLVIDMGLHYTGLIPGRDQDHAALGYVYADLSDRRGGHTILQNFEQVLELTYDFVVRAWWSIQPDVQWIQNPGGKDGPGHAFLLGLRSTLTF